MIWSKENNMKKKKKKSLFSLHKSSATLSVPVLEAWMDVEVQVVIFGSACCKLLYIYKSALTVIESNVTHRIVIGINKPQQMIVFFDSNNRFNYVKL